MSARAGAQGRRRPVPGVHAVPPGLGRARVAETGRHRRVDPELAGPGGQAGRAAGRADPRRRGGRRRPARRRRAGRARAVGSVPGRGGGRLRRGPEPPGQAGHLPDVGVPQVRGDPPPHDARRPGHPAVRVGGHLPHRARLARVLRRHPVPASGLRPRQLRPGLRRAAAGRGRRGARGVRRLVRGPHRLPDRRRRDAAAARAGLDAQPGPHDRGQLPGQGPAPAVVVGGAALHAAAGRRRPGVQPARLAVDGGQRHRRLAVLPGVQPGHPGREVRPERRLRAPVRAGAARGARQAGAPAVAAARRRPGRATRNRWSTTRPSGWRHWLVTSG